MGNFGHGNMRGTLVSIGHGFQNGEALTRMSDASLLAYLEGSIDTLQAAMLFGANPECYAAINACVANKSNQQFAAIVRKYLIDHPHTWQMGGGIIIYDAVFAGCFKRDGQ
jgi:hypothetical protein